MSDRGVLNTFSQLYNLELMSPQSVSLAALIFNAGNIKTAFHEIAQMNIAKKLSQEGYSPVLEFRIPGAGEADIVAGNFVWEVKSITQSGMSQLNKYIEMGGLKAGHKLEPIKEIPIIRDIKMGIIFPQKGIAKYYFYRKDKTGQEVPVPYSEVVKEWENVKMLTSAVVLGTVGVTILENVLTAGAGTADDIPSVLFSLKLGVSLAF